jgi:hypothetical protein
VVVGGYAERERGALMQVTVTKPAAAREMTEARECLHDGQYARIVQLQPGCSVAAAG